MDRLDDESRTYVEIGASDDEEEEDEIIMGISEDEDQEEEEEEQEEADDDEDRNTKCIIPLPRPIESSPASQSPTALEGGEPSNKDKGKTKA
ncbi:hypothetical protein JCGZ_09803 [Jatropha curcas]|uniref:Uncharacterized protein n=1 Tax=Jatropha curcas TaxID=180498 RepID=A0A067KJA6_JATCU|nr:hypothetical protein JCGZ_09803 [Jatropha curcas]